MGKAVITISALAFAGGWVLSWLCLGRTPSSAVRPGSAQSVMASEVSPRSDVESSGLDESLRVPLQPSLQTAPNSPSATSLSVQPEGTPNVMVSADWQQAVLTPLPYAGEDMDFSAKYANVPPEMLVPAYQLLTKHMTSVGQDILKERLKSGRYEEKFVQEGGSPEEVRGSADGKPLTVGFSTEHVSGGGSRVKKVEFSKEEYPEFRSIQLEYAWLHNHLHSLQLCKCGG